MSTPYPLSGRNDFQQGSIEILDFPSGLDPCQHADLCLFPQVLRCRFPPGDTGGFEKMYPAVRLAKQQFHQVRGIDLRQIVFDLINALAKKITDRQNPFPGGLRRLFNGVQHIENSVFSTCFLSACGFRIRKM